MTGEQSEGESMLQILETPKAIGNPVLVVEDDLPLLEVISNYLHSELKCEVHCAADREEAEALLDCYSYSLIITDISLTPQRLDGLDLIEEVADIHGRPGIVALSGYGTNVVKSMALALGADIFLEKPGPLSELASISRRLTTSSKPIESHKPTMGRLLRKLLSKDGISPLAQPIYRLDCNTHTLAGVECLSRGPVGSPFRRADALFAYARRKRAEHILDRHCISVALKAAHAIPAPIGLALNVHASTLGRSADFCDWLCATAAENSIDIRRLTIEIIEHAPVWNKSEFFQTLASLRKAGIRTALDDIGLGHSNFQMMVDVKPDYFKLDRYFVHGCHRDRYRRAVVTSVARLAKELDGSVIAEGIEDPADLEILLDAGIVLAQGFMFCPPVPVDQFQRSQEADNFCSCSKESRNKTSECPMKGLGLCSRTAEQVVESLVPTDSMTTMPPRHNFELAL